MKPGRKRKYFFAAYDGDELVDVGSAEELGRRLGIKPESVAFRATPAYARRHPSRAGIAIYRIED